ncbi:RHS repeat-associated core domain-containing protein [Arthrobacter rhizosphaerae]|uniref:RHS repeat-associated core domain-containing protein n=1 Tax=Arthrobacter rhizosphaerae TaxID=2855490 RepID=UPI001FF16875|nr:RHS repeat-associated core domain-containing protein [Arthrobacter rhizosphaerae]
MKLNHFFQSTTLLAAIALATTSYSLPVLPPLPGEFNQGSVNNASAIPSLESTPPAAINVLTTPEAPGTKATVTGASSSSLPESKTQGPAIRNASFPLAPPAANDKGAGDFTALPGTSSGNWGTTGQTGGFTWTYPISARKGSVGPSPELGLSYDSTRVDELTSATNNQASAIGDGWGLSGSGRITQNFRPCADQGVTGSYDLCGNPGGQNVSISFGGRSGELVKDTATGAWKLSKDDGSRVEYLTGAGTNGSHDGGHWKITDTSGTQYFFGLNKLPGWIAGNATTNSVDTLPVGAAAADQPCAAGSFAASLCQQAQGWNLDYIVDVHGNSQAQYYSQATNHYRAQAGTGAILPYVRSSRLDRIDYGMRAGSELIASAPLRIRLDYTERCTGIDCAAGTDVPTDLACPATGPCTIQSPTFYMDYRLTGVQTETLVGTAYQAADRWNLSHSMPNPGDGTKPALWLGSVEHQGLNTQAGQGTITDPPVVFGGQTLQNRVWVMDGLAPLNRFRISAIKTVTGATTAVAYNGADCSPTSLPSSPETNTRRCFPQWWQPTTPIMQASRMDWFHIYPVAAIIVDAGPGGAGSRSQNTRYQYIGTPAWKYPEPTYRTGTAGAKQTWSIAAGWAQVKTITAGSTTLTTYLRGLDKTPSNSSGGLNTAQQTATDGSVVTDSIWLAGRVLETQSLRSENGALLGTSVTVPWASTPTATGPAALGTPTARQQGTSKKWAKSAIDTGWRTTQSDTHFDSLGRPKASTHALDLSTAADDTCTTTSYADGTAANLLSLPAVISTYSGACTSAGAPAGNLLKSSQRLYDTNTSAVPGSAGYAAPTKGSLSTIRQAKAITGTAVTDWQPGPALGYDSLGRLSTATDTTTGTARTTTTAYSPAAGPATTVTVTNPLGWAGTKNLDPVRGQEISSVDPNGSTTTTAYDASGRTTGIWDPSRPKATNPVPTTGTTYRVSQTEPSWIKTGIITYSGGTLEDYKIYDGLGRIRQTQSLSTHGGSITTDTLYGDTGDKALERQGYYLSTDPDGILRIPSEAVPSSTNYQYDTAGRLIKTRKLAYDNEEQWATTIAYAGTNSVTTTGPGNEPAVTVNTDAAGKTIARKTFRGTTATGTADTTTYTYNPLQQMTGMTDPAGNTWGWVFDPLGRQTGATDPDTGATSTAYDTSSRKATAINGLGTVTTTEYDTLDRATKVSTALSGQPAKTLLTHTYDTEKKGQLASSTRFNGPNQDQAVTTTSSGYNANYQPNSVKVQLPASVGTLAGTYETKSTYGKSGLPAYVTYPAIGGLPQEAVSHTYNELDQPSGVSSQFGVTYIGSTERDNMNNVTAYAQRDNKLFTAGTDTMGSARAVFSWDYATGRLLDTKYSNNARNVITDMGTTKYTYEPSGQLTSRELTYATRPNGAAASDYQCYSYDHAGRLAGVWTPASQECAGGFTASGLGGTAPYAQAYEYNTAGDRSKATRYTSTGAVAVTEESTYPAAGAPGAHRLQSTKRTTGAGAVTTDSYGWDTAGQMTNRAGQTISYTPDGKIASTSGTSTVPRNPNPSAATGTTPVTGTGTTSQRYYTADGTLVAIIDGTGTTVTVGNATAFCATAGAISATRTYTFAGKTVAQRTSRPGVTATSVAFINGDSVNTAQVMTGPTTGGGTVGITAVKRHTDPFGLTRGPTLTAIGQTALAAAPSTRTGPGSNESNETGFSAATGYISGTNDTASTLTHLGARDYDPVLGIFTAPDPILKLGEAKNFSAYIYAEGDPVNGSDPSGLMIAGPRITDGGDSGGWRDHRATATPGQYVAPAFMAAPPTYFERLVSSSRAQPAATTSSNLDLIAEGMADPYGFTAYQNQYGNEAALATAIRYISFDVGWIPVFGAGSIGLDMLANQIEGKPAISEEDIPLTAMGALPVVGSIGKLGKTASSGAKVVKSGATAPNIVFGHGARHLEGTGLGVQEVESMIHQQVTTAVAKTTAETGSFWGRIELRGTTIEYRAYTLPDGKINVGTYYVP